MFNLEIKGIGSYAPGEKITNLELKKLANIEFDHEKIEAKLGIKTRHCARLQNIPETTADFGEKAARLAIAHAGIEASDIDLLVVGTDTPEHISPATAFIIQGRIQGGETKGMAFDIAASCASFTSAFHIVAGMMNSNPSIKHALVIGIYNMPAFFREGDAFGFSIFADGAGAIVLSRSVDGKSKYIAGETMVDGTQWDFIGIYAGGSKKPITHDLIDSNDYGFQHLKPLPSDRNVRLWPMVIHELLAKNNMKIDDVDHYIFTQINKSVIEKVMKAIGQPMSKTTCVMDEYGYTGSACVPMAFYKAVQTGKVKKGDKVLFIASGAGFAVAANLFTY